MKPIVVELSLKKDTKFKHVYGEDTDPAQHVFGGIYVQKTAFQGEPAPPTKIQVTVEAV